MIFDEIEKNIYHPKDSTRRGKNNRRSGEKLAKRKGRKL
jgi:hypothetical protein